MRRLFIALAALLLVLGVSPLAASASGDDDRAGGVSSGSGDDRDDDDRDDDDDDDDRDEIDDDDDADDSGQHRRRNRNRNRNRGGGDGAAAGGGATPPTGPAAANATVQVSDRSFDPATIRVAVGGTVTWENVSREHTVTADDNSFDSGVFDAGQRFSKTFPAPGSVAYRCLIHPEMTGEVVVGEGSQGATPPAAGRSNGASSASAQQSSGSSPASAGGSSGLPSVGTVQAPLTAAAADSADVDVADFEFTPAEVTVAPGGTVRWTLTGQAPHTVTSDTFDSGMLKAGDTYEQTFDDVGTIDYRCDFHPEMKGTVTVAETAAPAGDAGGAGASGGDSGTAGRDATQAAATNDGAAATGLLAESGFPGMPTMLAALGVILLGWAALVTGRRRGGRARRSV